MLAVKLGVEIDTIQYLWDTFKDTIDINQQNNDAFILAAHYNTNVEVIQYFCDILLDILIITINDNKTIALY